MDIFSHALWTGAIYKIFNLRKEKKKKYNLWWSAFWGIFPDLFAFSIPTIFIVYLLITGGMSISEIPKQEHTEPIEKNFPMYELATYLYNYSHSLIIFAIVFLISFFIFKKSAFLLFGWLLHILIDIPTHGHVSFPTPIFWPISNWKFNGVPWSTPEFLIANYISLIFVYALLFYYSKKTGKK